LSWAQLSQGGVPGSTRGGGGGVRARCPLRSGGCTRVSPAAVHVHSRPCWSNQPPPAATYTQEYTTVRSSRPRPHHYTRRSTTFTTFTTSTVPTHLRAPNPSPTPPLLNLVLVITPRATTTSPHPQHYHLHCHRAVPSLTVSQHPQHQFIDCPPPTCPRT
jgi:hypothetical protein